MAADAAEDMEVEVMVVSVVMAVATKEDVVEGAMIKNRTNLPGGAEHSRQKLVYTLQTNGDSSPCNTTIIFNK